MDERRLTRTARSIGAAAIAVCLVGMSWAGEAAGEAPAFPGAVGQGAAATGGRGGDVYHVTNLKDYNPDKDEEKIPGSFRHALRSATGPRTIVFDVSGAIALRTPLEIRKSDLTIAGQTSPGGITVWGYPTEIGGAKNVIVRYLRMRCGDFNARGRKPATGNGDLDAGSANALNVGGGERVILDHLSASWGMDETLSVTMCRDVTVQNSIIAESLHDSYHPKGPHGYGSLVRGLLTESDQQANQGGYTFFRNLWAHHRARNPSIGGEQRLAPGRPETERRRTDVNIVNNVVYDWGDQATHRSELGQVRINLVGNFYVTGPAKAAKYFFREKTDGRSEVVERGNWQDLDRDADHDGALVEGAEAVARAFQGFTEEDSLVSDREPLAFVGEVTEAATAGDEAYRIVEGGAGASLWRDAADRRVMESLRARSGGLINSQEEFRAGDGKLPGIDDLPTIERPADFDTDGDGMPNEFEAAHGLDADDGRDGNGTTLSAEGYTNLEVYLNSLVDAAPRHATARHFTPR